MDSFIKLFNRDLLKLRQEIESFADQENLWKTEGKISNSSGSLCLHIIGNLNHFIGAIIGHTGYVRDREAEFNIKNADKRKLLEKIDDTRSVVTIALRNFNKDKLGLTYPIQVFGEDMTYEFFLIHLVAHLNYHLGQINYLRRIQEK